MIKQASAVDFYPDTPLQSMKRSAFKRLIPVYLPGNRLCKTAFLLASGLISAPYSLAENCCVFIDESFGLKFRTEEDAALE